jgi:hypothetical protein
VQFHIGPWVYRVVIAPGALFDNDGAECAGLCVWVENAVKISGEIPRERRFDVLLHELRHAWRHHLSVADGDEDDANDVASFTAMCVQELVAQGGEKALMVMEPESDAPAPVERETSRTWAQPSPDGGTECGKCGRRFSAGEIATGQPELHPLTGKMIVPRGVYCDGCSHVQEWQEATIFDYSPSGQVVGKLRWLRGPDATDWLRRFGEQVGVLVA